MFQEFRAHVVCEGEDSFTIAAKYFGDESYFFIIEEVNGEIIPGREILIPLRSRVEVEVNTRRMPLYAQTGRSAMYWLLLGENSLAELRVGDRLDYIIYEPTLQRVLENLR